jgi:hypothetical protein
VATWHFTPAESGRAVLCRHEVLKG